jgi:hypothetical protein
MSPKYLVLEPFQKLLGMKKHTPTISFFFPKNIHIVIVVHADLPQLTALASHPQRPSSH